MGFNWRIKVGILASAIQSALRWVFGGYFPREWPLKLALIMGVSKTLFNYLSEFTIEEVLQSNG